MQCGCCIWFWFFGWTGQAWAYALIGLSPPSILMAGRTHCLRRFDHARTVTIRKYHYLMHKVLASQSAMIGLQHGYVSLAPSNEGLCVPATWLVLPAHTSKVSGSPIWSCQRSILWEDKSTSHKPWHLTLIFEPPIKQKCQIFLSCDNLFLFLIKFITQIKNSGLNILIEHYIY